MRPDFECPAQTRQCLAPLPLSAQRRAEVAVSFRILRHQLYGLAQRLKRLFTLPHQRHAECLPQHAAVRMDLEKPASAVLRLTQAPLIDQSDQSANLVLARNCRRRRRDGLQSAAAFVFLAATARARIVATRFHASARSSAVTRSNSSGQSPGVRCLNSRMVGYHGLSSRSMSQRQSGTDCSATQTRAPSAPAR